VKRVVVVIGLLAALVPLGSRPSWAACDCTGEQTPQGQADNASLVFTGRATAIDTPLPDTASVEFAVETLYKGVAGHSVEVTTPLGGDLCHFDFLPRTRYTVFANENSSTTACSGNVRGVINPKGYGLAAIPLSRISEARGAVAAWVWAVIGTALLFAAGGGLLVARRSTGRRSGPPSGRPAPGP